MVATRSARKKAKVVDDEAEILGSIEVSTGEELLTPKKKKKKMNEKQNSIKKRGKTVRATETKEEKPKPENKSKSDKKKKRKVSITNEAAEKVTSPIKKAKTNKLMPEDPDPTPAIPSKKEINEKLLELQSGTIGMSKLNENEGEETDANQVIDREVDLKKKYTLKSKDGVIKIDNIPHGFYEKEMEGYFSQFGDVENIRIPRWKRSFKAKGYAFVQFKHHEVAEIVQKTMDNMMIMENVLKCQVIAPEAVHDGLFRPDLLRRFRTDWAKRAYEERIRTKTYEEKVDEFNALLDKHKERQAEWKKLGINYSFPGHKIIKASK